MENIFHRVSIRKYEDKPVEKEKILQILKAGMQAPSACNQQPVQHLVDRPPWRRRCAGKRQQQPCRAEPQRPPHVFARRRSIYRQKTAQQ